MAAGLAFALPVLVGLVGLVAGNMGPRDFGYIVLLTLGAFVVVGSR